MFKKSTLILVAALAWAMAQSASAESLSPAEMELFAAATVSVDQAGVLALENHPGKLVSVDFGTDNGRPTYEVQVIGDDGQAWTVVIDANTGEVVASALSSEIENDGIDHQDGVEGDDGEGAEGDDGEGDEGEDGEGDDGEDEGDDSEADD